MGTCMFGSLKIMDAPCQGQQVQKCKIIRQPLNACLPASLPPLSLYLHLPLPPPLSLSLPLPQRVDGTGR